MSATQFISLFGVLGISASLVAAKPHKKESVVLRYKRRKKLEGTGDRLKEMKISGTVIDLGGMVCVFLLIFESKWR